MSKSELLTSAAGPNGQATLGNLAYAAGSTVQQHDPESIGGNGDPLAGWNPKDAFWAGTSSVALGPFGSLPTAVKVPLGMGVGAGAGAISSGGHASDSCMAVWTGAGGGSVVGDWRAKHNTASWVFESVVGMGAGLAGC
jgi:hypothetical protein